jgi:hypothetical protein
MSANKFKPKTVLLVPDVHAKVADSLDRMRVLRATMNAKHIKLADVVQIGDLWDFESLCLHDKESPEWYQRNLQADIDAGMVGLDILADIARTHGAKLHVTEGNHEDRYNRWMKSDNRLLTSSFPKTVRALIKQERPDLKMNYVDFLKPLTLYGAAFAHYFVSGVMNRPQGGERPAANILRTQLMTTICGHTHTMDYAQRTRADGKRVHALVSGSFVDPAGDFKYAGAARKLWWCGAHLLHFTEMGEFDLESISLARMS